MGLWGIIEVSHWVDWVELESDVSFVGILMRLGIEIGVEFGENHWNSIKNLMLNSSKLKFKWKILWKIKSFRNFVKKIDKNWPKSDRNQCTGKNFEGLNVQKTL